jgi:hypothetical protein
MFLKKLNSAIVDNTFAYWLIGGGRRSKTVDNTTVSNQEAAKAFDQLFGGAATRIGHSLAASVARTRSRP